MFYVILLLFFAIVSTPHIKVENKLLLFSIALAILPISVATDSYRYGLFVYDGGVIAAGVGLIINSIYKNSFNRFEIALYATAIILFIIAVWQSTSSPIDKYFIRDFRIFIYIFMVMVCAKMVYKFSVSRTAARAIFVISALSSILYWALINLGMNIVNDHYYIENSFRYIAVSTFMSATGLVFMDRLSLSKNGPITSWVSEILLLTTIIISGLRLLLLATLLVYVMRRVRTARGVLHLLLLFGAGLAFISTSIAINFEPVTQLSERMNDINASQFGADLETRLSPTAFNDSDSTDDNAGQLLKLVFGSGFGTTFYVPWFTYREGKDVYNNFVDSAYITMFFKFGFLSIPILYFPIINILKSSYSAIAIDYISLFIFLSLLYIGYCLPYQIDAIGVWIALCLIFASRPAKETRAWSRATGRGIVATA